MGPLNLISILVLLSVGVALSVYHPDLESVKAELRRTPCCCAQEVGTRTDSSGAGKSAGRLCRSATDLAGQEREECGER